MTTIVLFVMNKGIFIKCVSDPLTISRVGNQVVFANEKADGHLRDLVNRNLSCLLVSGNQIVIILNLESIFAHALAKMKHTFQWGFATVVSHRNVKTVCVIEFRVT